MKYRYLAAGNPGSMLPPSCLHPRVDDVHRRPANARTILGECDAPAGLVEKPSFKNECRTGLVTRHRASIQAPLDSPCA